METDIPPITSYTHSLKLEQTAKGLRVTVHVYANDRKSAVDEAFKLYWEAEVRAVEMAIQMAPVEVTK